MATGSPNPSAFVSYSWESDAHRQWALKLATYLHRNGVAVSFDQWDVRPGMNLQEYMESSVRMSDFVLLVCTPTYAAKANAGQGGVGYEKSIVTGEMFAKTKSGVQFVPLLRQGSSSEALPSFLNSKVFLDFREDHCFDERCRELLRHIHNVPAIVRPELGPIPTFDVETRHDITESQRVRGSDADVPVIEIWVSRRRYSIPRPDWWDEVVAQLPPRLRRHKTVVDYVEKLCGSDTGTNDTWRVAWKLWAQYYMRTDNVPAYLGHCYVSGGQFGLAAAVYRDVADLANLTTTTEWHTTYFSFEAGRSYKNAGELALAEVFLKRAASRIGTRDQAVRYYASEAVSLLTTLRNSQNEE